MTMGVIFLKDRHAGPVCPKRAEVERRKDVSGIENKKLALLRIWQILKNESDADHPLKQAEIVRRLKKDYEIELERKAVRRNLSLLKEAGIDIRTEKDGSWVDSGAFVDAELQMMIDFVRSSRAIAPRHAADLVEHIGELSNKYFFKRTGIRPLPVCEKMTDPSLFYKIEVIRSAQEKSGQIRYDLAKMGIDKKRRKEKTYVVTPFHTFFRDGNYCLMAYSEADRKMVYHRIDRIMDPMIVRKKAIPLEKVPGYGEGTDPKKICGEMALLSGDPAERTVFSADADLIDSIFDRFGPGVEMSEDGNDKVRVSLCVPPSAAREWALGHIGKVEILSPVPLRRSVLSALQKGIETYTTAS